MRFFLFVGIVLSCLHFNAKAQTLSEKYASLLTLPRGYVCYRTSDTIHIDGIVNEKSWQYAPYSEVFVDIRGYDFPKPEYSTFVKILWDDNYLYIMGELEEPHIWANLQKRDEIVYHDNDFEVFIDPVGEGHNYFEIETNARGTVFDLALDKPYRSPRRPFVQFQWNCPGLKLAIHCNGTINNPNDKDKGWTVEMAIPREAIASEFHNFLKAGKWLRINFSRVQWQHDIDNNGQYSRKKGHDGKLLHEDNWVWSPIGKIAMHMPERWGYLYLSDKKAGEGTEEFQYPEEQPITNFLWMLFYAQEEQYAKTKSYFRTFGDFHLLRKDLDLLPEACQVLIEATSHTYEITVKSSDGKQIVINELGRCFKR